MCGLPHRGPPQRRAWGDASFAPPRRALASVRGLALHSGGRRALSDVVGLPQRFLPGPVPAPVASM